MFPLALSIIIVLFNYKEGAEVFIKKTLAPSNSNTPNKQQYITTITTTLYVGRLKILVSRR